MTILSRAVISVVALATSSACTRSAMARRPADWRGEQGRGLTRTEMERAGFATTFDAIQALRPGELPATPPSSTAQVIPAAAVFVDASGHDVGLVSLHQFPVAGVCRVEFLHGAEARLRYGVGRAIVVHTVTGENCT